MNRLRTLGLVALGLAVALPLLGRPGKGRHGGTDQETPVAGPAPQGAVLEKQVPAKKHPAKFREAPPRARPVPRRLQSLGVRQLPPGLAKRQILATDAARSKIVFPTQGPRGQRLGNEGLGRAQMHQPFIHQHLRAAVQDRVLLKELRSFGRVEVVPGRYYWHAWRGLDYCHYYDPWGYHWYGWYLGPGFFWTRYYRGTWWWYDPLLFRWCFWYDGWWWWPSPVHLGVFFVYDGSDYVSSEDGP